ncbi:MAG: ASCH domain-containing protein [Bacilli bacterium]|nr:ASCH domain-containing protein [Bacilli bacterium]
MKALTIKNPWASLIINGYKEYEFRTWKTNYRGKILIHAGLGMESSYAKKVEDYALTYQKGAIIGEAVLDDCILVDENFNQELYLKNPLVYGNNHVGVYAWKLSNIKKYAEPIYVKGKLGLWNYEE